MPNRTRRSLQLMRSWRLALAACALVALVARGGDELKNEPVPQSSLRFDEKPIQSQPATGFLAIPAGWQPWWRNAMHDTLLARPERLEITADAVSMGSLANSAQIKVLRDIPAIQETAVAEACAQFDFRSFMESKFIDTSEPVGSTLTTGGPPRYLDQNWTYSAGFRKLGDTGARLEAAQKFGYEDSNSVFFVPDLQGTSRLSLSLTQPLLNGAGRLYNTSEILLARIDTDVANDRFARDLQNVLVEVQKTYWDLYRERAVLLQRRKLLAQGRQIYDELDARREVDVVKSQVARAKAAVATRDAAVVRQEALVLNAEAKLRALLNDPSLGVVSRRELIPVQTPVESPQRVALDDSLLLALRNRPEIDQATREIRAASVRLDISTNELMPVLNLILATYVSGLEGDADVGGAWEDQFASGRPTYSAGMLFEYPLGNRAAQARLKKRRLELRQLTNQLEVATANVRLEVEIAVREIATTYREMNSHYHAIIGGETEIEYLERRWRLLPGDQQVAGIVLDDLLNAQERLSRAEASYAGALAAYNMALVQLKRATGILLQCQPLDAPSRSVRGDGVGVRPPMPAKEAALARQTNGRQLFAAPGVHIQGNRTRPADVMNTSTASKPATDPRPMEVSASPPDPSTKVREDKAEKVWPPIRESTSSRGPSVSDNVQRLPSTNEELEPLPAVEDGPRLK